MPSTKEEFNKIHSRVHEKHDNKFQLAREFITTIHKNSKNQIEVEKIENIQIIYYRRYVYYYRTSGGMVTKVKALNKF